MLLFLHYMNSKKSKDKILKILKETYPHANCALNFSNPLELLIATILSAQCTDARVNQVTKMLFQKYRSVKDYANAEISELENDIRSTGFFRQKAKWVQNACKKINENFGGKVPSTMEELTSLSGVARKTANVVLGTAYKIPSGIVVDTHVIRLSKRLGLSKNTDPIKIEQDLMKIVPKEDWIWFAHALITHGRQICKAITPLCFKCPLNKVCPSSEV